MRNVILLTVLLALVVFALPTHAGKKPKDVNVVSPLPLPVTGDVNVANTPLSVTISNQETRVPFQHDLRMGGQFPVPVGMVAEVNFVYGYCEATGSTVVHAISVRPRWNGEDLSYVFPVLEYMPDFGFYTVSSRVRIFAEEYIGSGVTSSGGTPDCNIVISGYLSPMNN